VLTSFLLRFAVVLGGPTLVVIGAILIYTGTVFGGILCILIGIGWVTVLVNNAEGGTL